MPFKFPWKSRNPIIGASASSSFPRRRCEASHCAIGHHCTRLRLKRSEAAFNLPSTLWTPSIQRTFNGLVGCPPSPLRLWVPQRRREHLAPLLFFILLPSRAACASFRVMATAATVEDTRRAIFKAIAPLRLWPLR